MYFSGRGISTNSFPSRPLVFNVYFDFLLVAVCLVVNTSAAADADCLETLVSEITYYVLMCIG